MRKKLFTGILAISLAVLSVGIIIITGFLYNYYSANQVNELETELTYLSHLINEHGYEHVNLLNENGKITLIDKDGNVIIPTGNTFTQITSESEVVTEALISSKSTDTFYLSVLSKQRNMAEKLQDGSVVCVSTIQYTAISLILRMSGYVLAVVAVDIIIAMALSHILSKRILRPVNELDLLHPDKNKVYPELEPFVDKINDQNKRLAHNMQELETRHREQDKMRKEFTANVSHELKTPLTSISGYAEIIRDGFVNADDIPVFAGRIYDESKRMINLVGDIIKLSQLDENEINVKIERINLYECCQAVITNLEHQAAKKNVAITLHGDEVEISGAEVVIDEIVYNIIDNAVKYNKEGGKVDVTIRQCIDGVEMTVTDTGIGISDEDLPHIFERFYRADKSHSKEIGGTGLGLSIVKHATMFHNASVSVESKLGEGTTVHLLF